MMNETLNIFGKLGRLLPPYLGYLMEAMVSRNVAAYEPPKQTRSVLLFWRTPEDWAELLHQWVSVLLSHVFHKRY